MDRMFQKSACKTGPGNLSNLTICFLMPFAHSFVLRFRYHLPYQAGQEDKKEQMLRLELPSPSTSICLTLISSYSICTIFHQSAFHSLHLKHVLLILLIC